MPFNATKSAGTVADSAQISNSLPSLHSSPNTSPYGEFHHNPLGGHITTMPTRKSADLIGQGGGYRN